MTIKTLGYTGIAALVFGGALVAAPQPSHAAFSSVGACATGSTATVLSALQIQEKGATNNALPLSLLSTGAVTATTTTTATTTQEYGYLTYVSGIGKPFQDGPPNESAALLKFFSSASTVSDAAYAPVLSSTRSGTLSVYASTGQAGNFSMPASFQSGMPVLTATFTQLNLGTSVIGGVGLGLISAQQVNLTAHGQGIGQDFSSAATATITATTPFSLDGACYQLGSVGATFTVRNVGHLASPTSANGAFSGVWGTSGVQ